jgi:hypothetical protein
MPDAAPDVRFRDLADQRQHRRVHRIGREQRGARVQEARSRHHRIGMRLVGRERGAERHVARALFMARMHHAQLVARLEERVEQEIVVHARQRVDGVETIREQRRV